MSEIPPIKVSLTIKKPVVLAFLQNQWFNQPKRIEKIYDSVPFSERHRLNRYFLFRGCLTGIRLKKAFGALCDEIIWSEISPKIGAYSGAVFQPDNKHIEKTLDCYKPNIILAFGKIAGEGVASYMLCFSKISYPIIDGPHPAARKKDVTKELDLMAVQLVVEYAKASINCP